MSTYMDTMRIFWFHSCMCFKGPPFSLINTNSFHFETKRQLGCQACHEPLAVFFFFDFFRKIKGRKLQGFFKGVGLTKLRGAINMLYVPEFYKGLVFPFHSMFWKKSAMPGHRSYLNGEDGSQIHGKKSTQKWNLWDSQNPVHWLGLPRKFGWFSYLISNLWDYLISFLLGWFSYNHWFGWSSHIS